MRRADELLNAVQIASRGIRQLVERSRVAGRRAPSFERLVHRLRALEQREVARKFFVHIVADAICRADAKLIERVEHVELGDSEIGQTVDAYRVSHDHGVEPAASARAAGRCTELVAELAQPGLQRLGELRWQRAVSHARGVRLHDADASVERARRDPDADRGARGRRRARRDERIRAVVDVEQRALRAFEQDRGFRRLRAMDREADVLRERQQPRRDRREQRHRLVDVCARGRAPRGELRVGVRRTATSTIARSRSG